MAPTKKTPSSSSKKSSTRKASKADGAQQDYVRDLFRTWGHLHSSIDPVSDTHPQVPSPLEDFFNKPGNEELKKAYCGKIGSEFMHMPFMDRREWLSDQLENGEFPIDERGVLKRILSVESFEKFLHTKYVGAKRFSLEGLSVVVPLLDSILDQSAENGVEVAMIAMAHRGRLNVMHHIADTLAEHIVANFEDVDPRSALGSDDVKYHKGATGVYVTSSGKKVEVVLAPNPSHLEFVNPVIMGRTKARQIREGDDGSKIMCIILHGDAAFAGQGVAAESLNYASIPGFDIGGTVHVIVNNLIGFTATQPALFSGSYCTDVARRIDVPIFHVNGDSPRDVIKVGTIGANYRSKFSSDVVVDVVGYRRYGHNEMDDPTVTSPVLYRKIKDRPVLFKIFAEEIGVEDEDIEQLEKGALALFEEGLRRGREMTEKPQMDRESDHWSGFEGGPYQRSFEVDTAVDPTLLSSLGATLISPPEDFTVHPKLKRLLQQRGEMMEAKRGVDWGMAEALAFGSLLSQGTSVRLVGQDSVRGTFSHRHAGLYDYQTGEAFFSLRNTCKGESTFEVYDSLLSEAAAVGFEYGYSRDFPDALTLWEAQFGDFVNGAQILIDQFLSAGEDKWSTLSGLVMLLPHGYEGAGPEHSSARLERFLQLCAEDNMQVCQPSNSVQFFHLLRRQALRSWRKPLIVMTPKSMLRLPAACSPISNFSEQSRFLPLLDSGNENYAHGSRLIFCSGKIVHELRAARESRGDTDTVIVALEQFYPTPEKEIREVLRMYSSVKNIVWVQDEPANMGGLSFMRPILERISGLPVFSVKRSASASPATGSPRAHMMEQEALIQMAFGVATN